MTSGDSEDDKDNNNDEDAGGWRWGCNDEDDGDDILLVRSNFLYLFLHCEDIWNVDDEAQDKR